MNKLDLIQPEYLSGAQRELCDTIGIEAYRKLVSVFGGERLAVAKLTSLFPQSVRVKIISENLDNPDVLNCIDATEKEIERIRLGLR